MTGRAWWRSGPVGYVLAGGGSMLLDVGTLVLLRSGLGVPLAVATTVAYLVGFVANFLLNRYVVFSSSTTVVSSGLRYTALVAFNYAMTLAIVTGAAALGVPYLVGKGAAVALTLVWNYLAYKTWVFADRPQAAGADRS